MIHQGERTYRMIFEYRDAWKPEAFRERYSEVLDRYDYIVGDWGYNQLRLKGFYKDDNPKATKETSISSLQDYLQEYCNFGCAYFVIERVHHPDRLEPGGLSPEQSITITELPATDRYAEWQAFLSKLQEEREQQGENGDDRNGRRPYRQPAVAGEKNQTGKRRRNGTDWQDRQTEGDEPANPSQPSRKPADGSASGQMRPGHGNRNGQNGSAKRHPGNQQAANGKRQGDGQGAREGSNADKPKREWQENARQTGQQRDANPQEGQGAANQPRAGANGKGGKHRHWNRNRRNRHHHRPDKPAEQGGETRNHPGGAEPARDRSSGDARRE